MQYMSLFVLAIVFFIGWTISLVTYRFFFHPLSCFPGPKLAIATYAYEWYYDLVLGGQYTFKLRELHAKYGPVVRLNPDELHFNDPDYYDEIFNVTNGETDKPYRVANAFGAYPAALGTAGHDIHRMRRGALNPFFSKRSVLDLVPFIQNIIDKLCDRFDDASKTGEPMDLKYCYAALTLDIMNEYCFSMDSQTVMKPNFGEKSFKDVDSFLEISLLNIHIPWIMRSMYSLPDWFMRIINPAMRDILDMRENLAKQVEDIRYGRDVSSLSSGHRTVFHDLLESKLPPREMARDRLRDEAFSLITAGSGTSAYVVRNLSYHIAANPHVQQKLLKELRGVMPHPTDHAELQVLEQLPYLTAVLQEGLRITHPVTHRLSRSFPKKTLIYKNREIPPGTVVNMTTLLIHENEDVFRDAQVFRPERWLDSKNSETPHHLQRYLVAFSRGSRSCLGINLAWAELYLIVASVFRRFEFDVEGVVRERDIDVAKDVIMGVPRADSKGIVVKVLQIQD